MSKWAAVAFLGQQGTRQEVATREFNTDEELVAGVKEMLDEPHVKAWQALTIVHVEDLPAVMMGAVPHEFP
jgi:hypothetical protein